MLDNIKEGNRVKVTFEGEVQKVFGPDSPNAFFFKVSSGFVHAVSRHELGCDAVEIERLAPEHWPPRVGDIWEVDGAEYVAREHSERPGVVIIEGVRRHQATYHDPYTVFKDRGPRLVRRRDGS